MNSLKLFVIGLVMMSTSGYAQSNQQVDNTFYARNAYNILKQNGYNHISILDQKDGNCTMAGPWDWNAATFSAFDGLVKKTGAVCGGKIYLTNAG